jgi:eukaryotic-like serine/threonine-protein kinase
LLATTLVVGLAIVGRLNQWRLVDVAPPHPPSVLVARAHEIIQSLGYPHPPADSAYWFTHKASYLEQVLDRTAPFFAKERDPLRPFPALRFVYRESPAQLVPANIFGMVLYRDPPAEVPGMLDINLDGQGRLLRFCAIARRREPRPASGPSMPDWGPLLRHAGLRLDALSSVTPAGIPPVAYDVLVEWKIVENASDRRVTAAAFDGAPVYFDVHWASPSPPRPAEARPSISRLTTEPTVALVSAALALVCAVVIARYHALRGQIDKRGASRLALYFFIINVAATVLLPDHLTHFGEEYFLAAKFVAWGLYWCASAAVLYLAFEPFVRRQWPAMLIGWTRIMAGGVRDPVVGRDVIVGTVAGTLMVCIMWLVYAEGNWLNLTTVSPLRPALESFREPRHLAVLVMFLHTATLALGLGGLLALAAFDRLLRARWLARAAWVILALAFGWPSLTSGLDWKLALQAGLAQAMLAGTVLWRFGPIGLAAALFTRDMLTHSPAALEFSAWYSNRSLIALAIVLAIGLYAAGAAVGFTRDAPKSPAR